MVSNLVEFDVSDNKFNDNLLEFLGDCPSLTNAQLHDNQLSGDVPSWL